MLKKLKNMKKKIVIADGLLLAAMAVVFGTTYDINPHKLRIPYNVRLATFGRIRP